MTNKTFTSHGVKRIRIDGKVPTLKECVAYMETLGWFYSHKSITGHYVFIRKDATTPPCLSWQLHELRETLVYGW